MMVSSEEIIREAREWIGTPFVHQGRQKGIGCDCGGVIAGIAKILNMDIKDLDGYGRQPKPEKLIKHLEKSLIATAKEDLRPANVILCLIRGVPQHIALITDKGMIHADLIAGKVVEHILNEKWKKRIYKVYRIPGVV